MNNSLIETMVAIDKLQRKIDGGIGDVDRKRALETMNNLVINSNHGELVKLLLAHYRMVVRLRRILQSWHINKRMIQQSIENARQFNDTEEEVRLTGRMAGVESIYEQVKDAVNLSSELFGKRWKPETESKSNAKTDL